MRALVAMASSLSFAARFRAGVLYTDNHVVCFNKPAGLLSQGDRTGDPCVNALAKAFVAEERGTRYAACVHRLDRPATGALLVATTSKAAKRLSAAFAANDVAKTYLVVLDGKLAYSAAAVAASASVDVRTSKRTAVRTLAHQPDLDLEAFRGVRDLAFLRYRVITRDRRRTLAAVDLLTGRRHQIRAQFAALGAPVVGDAKYGTGKGHTAALALHAVRIVAPHPVATQPRIDVRAPVPRDTWMRLGVPRHLIGEADGASLALDP